MAINGNFQFRRGTASLWASSNPILLSGELGLETDTAKFKIGDGTSAWNSLPYGGIKGDTGIASQTIVGATTVINPNQNPSVTDADAGANADLRFSLPRAREVVAQTTNTVSPSTAASVTQTADAEGDVNLTFNIPRGAKGWTPVLVVVSDGERRVLRLIDYIDGEGTKPTIPTDNYVGTAGLTTLANAVDIRGAVGATGPAANAFTNIAVSGQTTVSAEVANDTLTLANGTGIAITTDAANDSITVTNNDRGSQQNIFKNISVSGQNTIVADTNDGTLTIVGSGSVTVTTDAANDTITIAGAVAAPQNCFAVITGNTGTATADTPTDTLAITGGTGISTTATDTPDGLVITNTDTGSAARAAHEAAADPHPQYLTQAEGDVLYQAAGQSAGPAMASSVLAATQANTTVTAADINGQVFTIPPGKTARIQGNLIFTAAAATTGAFYGFRVVQGAGANGNAQGSWNAEVSLTSAAAATGIADGDAINAAGGATVASGILGTASVAGNNSAWIMLTVVNRSTNANTTVALQFRSEVAGSAVTAQIGTSAVAIIG